MKKLILLIFATFMANNMFAQSIDAVYVVFTSTEDETAGVWHTEDYAYNTELYRSPPHSYTILNRTKGYFYKFIHLNWLHKPDDPVVIKPAIFLDTLNYIDWDALEPTMTKAQVEALYQNIISHSIIYFIDRMDPPTGTIRMVPVGVMRSRY